MTGKIPLIALSLWVLLGSYYVAAEPLLQNRASLFSAKLEFIDDRNKAVSLSSLAGTPTIVSMVYTRCNGSCPLTIRRLKLIDKKLVGLGAVVNFALVAFDTENDVAEKLRQFRHENQWGDRWHLWRGSETATRIFSVLSNISYQRDPETGHFSHGNKIILLDRSGNIAHTLDGLSAPVDEIVEVVSKLK